MSDTDRIGLAVEILEQVGLELAAASALVGMAGRTATGDAPGAEALMFTRCEAQGFALQLRHLGDQLCRAGTELRAAQLEPAV